MELQVTVDNTSACERHITVVVPRTDIDRYYEQEYDELLPKAEVSRTAEAADRSAKHRGIMATARPIATRDFSEKKRVYLIGIKGLVKHRRILE